MIIRTFGPYFIYYNEYSTCHEGKPVQTRQISLFGQLSVGGKSLGVVAAGPSATRAAAARDAKKVTLAANGDLAIPGRWRPWPGTDPAPSRRHDGDEADPLGRPKFCRDHASPGRGTKGYQRWNRCSNAHRYDTSVIADLSSVTPRLVQTDVM
jgi:hypothetical protein